MMSLLTNCAEPALPSSRRLGAVVHLVHANSLVRESLARLLVSNAIGVVSFGSAREYLEYQRCETLACLVIDLHLPDVHGLDLQQQLSRASDPPIIFVSDQGDTQCTVRAIKAGAMDFLIQPVEADALLRAVDMAFSRDAQAQQEKMHIAMLQQRLSLLSPREREVLPLVVSGLRNKQVAWELNISEVTVQVHRGKIMRKMEAASFAELVRMAGQLTLARTIERTASTP